MATDNIFKLFLSFIVAFKTLADSTLKCESAQDTRTHTQTRIRTRCVGHYVRDADPANASGDLGPRRDPNEGTDGFILRAEIALVPAMLMSGPAEGAGAGKDTHTQARAHTRIHLHTTAHTHPFVRWTWIRQWRAGASPEA